MSSANLPSASLRDESSGARSRPWPSSPRRASSRWSIRCRTDRVGCRVRPDRASAGSSRACDVRRRLRRRAALHDAARARARAGRGLQRLRRPTRCRRRSGGRRPGRRVRQHGVRPLADRRRAAAVVLAGAPVGGAAGRARGTARCPSGLLNGQPVWLELTSRRLTMGPRPHQGARRRRLGHRPQAAGRRAARASPTSRSSAAPAIRSSRAT